jgi:hypothetical protein
MCIQGDGKVGIGTANQKGNDGKVLPLTAPLDVNEEIRATKFSVNANGDFFVTGKVGIGGGLHVGGDSDPGEENLQVEGRLMVTRAILGAPLFTL